MNETEQQEQVLGHADLSGTVLTCFQIFNPLTRFLLTRMLAGGTWTDIFP